jgi:hypothetical protein
MLKRRKTWAIGVIVVLGALLALAWYDGGREEQRMIVQPVELTESGA